MSQQCSPALTGIIISCATRESCAVPTFSATKGQWEWGAERYTESIGYVTGGPILVTHWELVETEPDPITKKGKVAENKLNVPPSFSSLPEGSGKEELGSSSCIKLFLGSHWLDTQIGFRDAALFRELNNKVDTSVQRKYLPISDSPAAPADCALLGSLFLTGSSFQSQHLSWSPRAAAHAWQYQDPDTKMYFGVTRPSAHWEVTSLEIILWHWTACLERVDQTKQVPFSSKHTRYKYSTKETL